MIRYFKTVLKLMFVLLFFVQKVNAQQTLDSLIEPTAGLIKISDQFSFTEGPAVNKQGDIYFTDQPNDKIWKYDINGNLSLFMDKTGRSNGLYFDKKGNIISCADENNELWSISPDKKIKILLTDFEGKKLNGPNDLWIDAKGGIYFTDPYYQRDYWTRKRPEMDGKKLYYLPAGKKIPIIVDDKFVQPNGIVGTADGKYLYVADIGDSKIYKYSIKKDGTLSERHLFAPEGSDGMTLDTKGNLYITGKGVTVYDASGLKIGSIPVPANWVGNICFGGKDRKLLFITASESVYSMQMKVAGVE
ncbi:MAG: SMP-30/gluconolactonase/LRE family protein [Agriterribacter sp.]